jgi:AmmeMemoRadiSam system protein B
MGDLSQARRAQFADGRWYPGDAETLRRTVQGFLDQIPERRVPGEVIGLISPHAGYSYSGQVAAHAYRQLEGTSFDLVVVVSPLHRINASGLVITDNRYYETPLGLVDIDVSAVKALEDRVRIRRVRTDDEHSLEIQLPFLQVVLGDFALLPLMMGTQDWETVQELADALVAVVEGKRVLLLASSDLYHGQSYEDAVTVNQRVEKRVSDYDVLGLAEDLAGGSAQACGGGSILAVMLAAQALGAEVAEVLSLTTSADVTGNRWGYIVGYMAACLCRKASVT